MEFPIDFQKLCHVTDTRKLVFLMTAIAFLVLSVQFVSIPYGSVLVSMISKTGDSLPKSEVISDSTSNNSSGSAVVVKSVVESDLGGNIKLSNETMGDENGPDHDLEIIEDIELENEAPHSLDEVLEPSENSQFGGVGSSQESSDSNSDTISEKSKVVVQGNSPPLGEVSVGTAQKEGSNLTLERAHDEDIAPNPIPLPSALPPVAGILVDIAKKEVSNSTSKRHRNEDSASVPLPSALPPVASSNNRTTLTLPKETNAVLTLSKETNANLSTPVISGNSNVSSVGKQSAQVVSTEKKPETIGTSQSTSKEVSTVAKSTVETSSLEMPNTPVTSLSDMNILLRESRASSRSKIPRWHSVRDEEILSAKSQIENAPILKNSGELYAPIFRNVSMFKRSYELMEKILKVYVYKEGAQPIFHRPETKGIYASEGWFMKHMEGNRQFSVNDPSKAHLFYMPFSSRRLQQFLYVPNSHSHKNLIEHLKSYLDLISAKYPYWNRTDGADHFVVACHDWAPTETKQYMSNCIRALCNADIQNEGFVMGKDVSLPETNVRQPKDPLKNLGGKPPSKREILAFFAGSMHGYVRPILLQHWENKDPAMEIYGHMGRSGKNKANYVQHMKNSKYCICAKGFEVNSPRVVEAIFYECVPVIISDNFVPPFFEVLNWETFAVFIPEKDIPNLKNILLSISDERYRRLQMRVKKVQRHFLWNTKPVKYDVFHMTLHSIWLNRVFQISVA